MTDPIFRREASVSVPPEDSHNQSLVHHVHPPDWVNPEPRGKYNLVVLGAGTAGLVTAAVGAALGAKVALIERYLMGGDCLNVGCVPSKAVIRSSRAWAGVKRGREFGFRVSEEGVHYDFAAAMERMRRLRARISQTDSAQRFKRLGVDVFLGEGRFSGLRQVNVEERVLEFSKAAICTGGRPVELPIPGLREAGYLTNETVFELVALPRRLAVIGAGPIGCELAQAFARFGSRVTVFEQECRILPREDADAAKVVEGAMSRDGVHFLCEIHIDGIQRTGSSKEILFRRKGQAEKITVDEILIGIGRQPNVEGLDLEKAGVAYDRKGVTVNGRLQTTNPKIFAAGDICFPLKFTHTADAMAQMVIQNALFPHPFGLGYASTDSLIVPWCTYTDPEIAHVGLYEAEAQEKGLDVQTFTHPLNEVDRAILDGEEEGFARIHVKKGTDRILGATIVASHAGDMISEITLAMKGGLGLESLSGTIHPYPTQAEVIKKAAVAWRKTTLTEGKKKFLKRLFAWTR